MAPTSKSTTASSKSAANGNPAPDYTLNMNRIRTQMEARIKAFRTSFPSRSDLPNTNNNTSTSTAGPFSTLSSGAPTSTPQSRSQSQPQSLEARRKELEAEFAEEQGLDPNAGIGTIRASKSSAENGSGNDRETARLRGRLLGKRGANGAFGDKGQQKWMRKEESSDEEAGRSGLGRSKRNGKKRSRAEAEDDEGADRGVVRGDSMPDISMSGVDGTPAQDEGTDEHEDDAENAAVKSGGEDESKEPTSEGNPKKKRKRSKKKKSKKQVDGDLALDPTTTQ
ncbi:hypothetical protein M426DRAFT_319963 [Hypoxylon sp. CI-4A]|nr:hypothetical protein M426DRAFT_319963 [Hypoxylon sp. CI-4A]